MTDMTEYRINKISEPDSNNFSKFLKTAYSFEGWKFTMLGSLLGTLSGAAAAYLIPQSWVKNNKTLNKYFITGAEFPEKIYVP